MLTEVARAAPPGTRAFHPAGMADVSGWIGMGCAEILVHTGDIARGLGLPYRPPDELCSRVRARLFPWAPADIDSLGQSALGRWPGRSPRPRPTQRGLVLALPATFGMGRHDQEADRATRLEIRARVSV